MNKKNEFNVAYGHYKNPVIFDEENILSLSQLFNSFDVHFHVCDYVNVVRNYIVDYSEPRSSDTMCRSVIYLDPPYFNSFDKYSKHDFCYKNYINVLKYLHQFENLSIIHSNSVFFSEIYESNENIEEIRLYDRINSKNPGKIRIELLYFS